MDRIQKLISLLLLVGLAVGCQPSGDKTRVVKIGLEHSKNHSFTQALERLKEGVEKETDGRYEIRIFHSGQIGSESQMLEMLTIGSLEIALAGSVLNSYEPLFTLFEMPYLYRDRAHLAKVNNGPILEDVAKSMLPNGIRVSGFYENGWRNITNSIRPIEKPSDVEGLMIRTPENPAQIQTIKALGGIPTPMAFSELYTALLQGVVDGQENPLQNIWHGRLYEAQQHVSMTRHIYNSAFILLSERFWQQIPPDDQAIFRKYFRSTSDWQLKYMEELDLSLEKKLKEKGMQFSYPNTEPFEAACQAAYEAMYAELGPESREIVRKIKRQ